MKGKKKRKAGGELLLSCFIKESLRANSFTAANYQNGMQSVRRFLGDDSETFEVGDVSHEWVSCYLMYMRDTDKLSAGSMDCYMRLLRAVYNRTVREGVIIKPKVCPFVEMNIRVPPTLKRSLSEDEMHTLISADLLGNRRLSFARDLFLFLFCARGMCFIDVFNLTYHQVSGGFIRYCRSKTGVSLCVKIEPEMQRLMDKYREPDSLYVFPSLRRNCYKTGKEVSEPTASRRLNRQLNELGKLLGFGQCLTVYVARHTWASHAEASGMGLLYTSEGLGHSSERVTRIYMKGIPSENMDKANRKMLDTMVWNEKMAKKSKKNEASKKRCPILCKNETSKEKENILAEIQSIKEVLLNRMIFLETCFS